MASLHTKLATAADQKSYMELDAMVVAVDNKIKANRKQFENQTALLRKLAEDTAAYNQVMDTERAAAAVAEAAAW